MARAQTWMGSYFWRRFLPTDTPTLPKALAIALACLVGGLLLRTILSPWVSGALFLTFYPLVVISSVWGGGWAGVVVVVGAAAFAMSGSGLPAASSLPWAATITFVICSAMMISVVVALQDAMQALRKAENEAEIMAREMRHRVSNIIQLVQSIAHLTWRSCPDQADFLSAFEGRLVALSQSHRISSGSQGAPPDFEALLRVLLSAYGPERFRLCGPSVELPESIAPRVGLIIHELATNAAKYGALSVQDGMVNVEWEELPQFVEIRWVENNGPPVRKPQRHGFGSKLIPAALSGGLGEVETVFAPEGVRSFVRIYREHHESTRYLPFWKPAAEA